MSTRTKFTHTTPAGGNVFSDLGFDPMQATEMQAASLRIISEKLAIKEQLMGELADWINQRKLKQTEAAALLGITGQRVTNVIHRNTDLFTIDALVDMLVRTGMKIRLAVD